MAPKYSLLKGTNIHTVVLECWPVLEPVKFAASASPPTVINLKTQVYFMVKNVAIHLVVNQSNALNDQFKKPL